MRIAYESNDSYRLNGLDFDADSYCPNFLDDQEGSYSLRSVTPVDISGLPRQIEMDSGTEEEVCLQDLSLAIRAEGTLTREGTEFDFEINLNFVGDTWTSGSTTADCEV